MINLRVPKEDVPALEQFLKRKKEEKFMRKINTEVYTPLPLMLQMAMEAETLMKQKIDNTRDDIAIYGLTEILMDLKEYILLKINQPESLLKIFKSTEARTYILEKIGIKPSAEDLLELNLVKKLNSTEIGYIYTVSSQTVFKWFKHYNLKIKKHE